MAQFRKSMTLLDRLLSQSKPNAKGCVEWQGHTVNGYGKMRVGVKRVYTHRLSYEIQVSPVPEDVCVLHKFDNPRCINPEHLFLGNRADNNADKVAKGRQAKGESHGMKGEKHPLSRLSNADVSHIRTSYLAGAKQKELAAAFMVSQSNISQIVNSKRWSHGVIK